MLPFCRHAVTGTRTYSTFTLNQFNLLVEYGRPGLDLAQIHLYPYNPASSTSCPGCWDGRGPATRGAKRIVAGLGYLPSWASPAVELKVEPGEDHLPPVHLSAVHQTASIGALARVIARLYAVAPALDLWPAVPALRVSGPAKSYHFGGSFPHVTGAPRADRLETDTLGRPAEWSGFT